MAIDFRELDSELSKRPGDGCKKCNHTNINGIKGCKCKNENCACYHLRVNGRQP